MAMRKITASALAAVVGLSGIASILVIQNQPRDAEAVQLEPAIRRDDDDGRVLTLVDDDGASGDGNDTDDGDNTGDGDNTRGDDGTSGGNNTGDGDSTRGDDGTSGGNNTGDDTNTGGDTGGGDTTD